MRRSLRGPNRERRLVAGGVGGRGLPRARAAAAGGSAGAAAGAAGAAGAGGASSARRRLRSPAAPSAGGGLRRRRRAPPSCSQQILGAGRRADRRRRRRRRSSAGAVWPGSRSRMSDGRDSMLREERQADARSRRTAIARMPVVRVSTLPAPRPVMKRARAAADAERAAFGALQQHQADHGQHHHQVDHDEDSRHKSLSLARAFYTRRRAALKPQPPAAARTMARKSAAFRLAPPTSPPFTSGEREDRRGVVRLHRAAIEDAHLAARRAEARRRGRRGYGHARRRCHPRSACGRCRSPRPARRRSRCRRDRRPAPSRRAGATTTASVSPASRSRLRLADADDRRQPGAARGLRLGAHQRVGLAVVGAPLRMADDDRARARHPSASRPKCRRYARPRPSAWQSWPPIRSGVSFGAPAHLRDQRRRRAEHHVDPPCRAPRAPSAIARRLVEAGGEPVHLPVAGDQMAHVGRSSCAAPSAARRSALGSAGRGSYVRARRGGDAPGLFLSARGFFMLDQLRQGAQGWVSKVLMGLLVLSFAIWGIGGFEGYGAGTLATVGDAEVSVQEFAPRATSRCSANAQQPGQQVSPEQVLAAAAPRTPRSTTRRASYNLGVSDDRVARRSPRTRASRAPDGSFDRDRFSAILQNAGIDRDDYVRDMRRRARARADRRPRSAPASTCRSRWWRRSTASRTRSAPSPSSSSTQAPIEPVGAPDAATLQAYFDENKERFRAPEYRKLGCSSLDPAALADPGRGHRRGGRRRIRAPQGELHAAGAPAHRADPLRHAGGRRGGAADDRGRRGFRRRLPQAAAGRAGRHRSGPEDEGRDHRSRGRRGGLRRRAERRRAGDWRARSSPRSSASPRSSRAPSRRSPRWRRGSARISPRAPRARRSASLYDQVEDERAGGATLEEIAQEAVAPLPRRRGRRARRHGAGRQRRSPTSRPSSSCSTEAFESDVGVENNPIRGGDETCVFFDVLEITPERDRTLDEVRDEVVEGVDRRRRPQNRIAEKADALLARLQKRRAARHARRRDRQAGADGGEREARRAAAGLSANAAAQAFAGPEGHVANAEGDAPPARILLKVDKVTAPAFFAEAADVAGDQGAAVAGAAQRRPADLQPPAPAARARPASTTPPSQQLTGTTPTQ